MNAKQYNNVIDWTLKHEVANTDDSLAAARAIFRNMGVALPHGDCRKVFETLKRNTYMSWRACSAKEAKEAADKGIAAIGINIRRIAVLAAETNENPANGSDAETALVITVSEATPAHTVLKLNFFIYCEPQKETPKLFCSNGYLNQHQMASNARYIMKFLKSRGWTRQAICGLLSNMQTESTINPGLWDGSYKNDLNGGIGLLQWTPAAEYIDWAKKEGIPAANMDSQLKRLLFELYCGHQWQSTVNYPMSFTEYTRSTQPPHYLARVFLENYKRATPDHMAAQKCMAQAMYWYNTLI